MTLATTISDAGPFLCNSATTAFPFAFRIDASDEIEVVLIDADGVRTVLAINTDYSVSGVGLSSGGNVTTVETYATGYKIYLRRNLSLEQSSAFENQSRFNATALESALDRLAMQDQFLRDDLDRTFKTPLGDAALDDLPDASARAGNIFEFDDEGAPQIDRSVDEVVALALSRVVANVTLTPSDMASAAALRAAINALPGLYPIVPRGTWPINTLADPTEIDISLLGGLAFAPGAVLLPDNPVRAMFRASNATGLITEGINVRFQFAEDPELGRPDPAWQYYPGTVDDDELEYRARMLAWINAWNAFYGASISTVSSSATFKDRWDAAYSGTPFANWLQHSASGRQCGLLLNGCSRMQLYGLYADNCSAQISDQGGVATGDDLYSEANHIDLIRACERTRFGYLGKKSVNTRIDSVIVGVGTERDTGGAPHIGLYVSGEPTRDETNANLWIGSIQDTGNTIGASCKFKEANVHIDSFQGDGIQGGLALLGCTGSIGAIKMVNQKRTRDGAGALIPRTGQKYVVDGRNCHDLTIGSLDVQMTPSTAMVSQDALGAISLENCDNIRLLTYSVECTNLTASKPLGTMALVTNSYFGSGRITNRGDERVAMWEFAIDGVIGGSSLDNSFEAFSTSGLVQFATIAGSTRRNRFKVDPGQIDGGFVEGVTISDTSYGASNEVVFVTGERVVPLSSAPSFKTRANAALLLSETGLEDDDGNLLPTNFFDGDAVGVAGTIYRMSTSLSGGGNRVKIATEAEGGGVQTVKRLRAAINGDAGSGTTYSTSGAHATFQAVSAGRELAVFARTPGAAANGAAMTFTPATSEVVAAAWSGNASGGDLVDTALLNCLLDMTAGSGVTVALPDPALAPEGTRLTVRKADTATGPVTVTDHLGAAVVVIRRPYDQIELGPDTGTWKTITASSPHVARRGDTSERLSITDYADTPTSDDWTDIFTSAMAAGYRNIYADDRTFKFNDLAPSDGTRLEFGPNHTIDHASPGSSGYMLYLDGSRNVSIIRPFFDLPAMLEANTGSMANVSVTVFGGGISNTGSGVLVLEGGSGYTPSNGTFDYPLPAGDGGTGGVITFTTVGGVITSGTVKTAGSGYVAVSGGRMPVGRSQFTGYCIFAGDPGGDYCENILIQGVRQKYGRGLLRVDGANNITVRDCLLEDGGSGYIGMTFEKATNFRALANRIYRGHGSAFANGCGIRVSGDGASILQTGLIANNIIEDILTGNGIDSNLCNVRDLSILGNIVTMRNPLSVVAYQLKQGIVSTLTDMDQRGAKGIFWRDNQAIAYHSAAYGWDLQNNIDGEAFEPWLDRTNIIDFRGCDDTTSSSSYAVRGTGLTGGMVAPTIVDCQTGVRLTGGTPGYNRNVIIAPLIRKSRYGIWIDDVGRSVGVRDADIVASEIGVYVSETGTSDFRIEDTKVRIRGRRLNSITINTAGTGYTNGTYDVYANGGGLGLVFEVTATAGGLTSASLTAGGFGYLGGASGSFKITIDPPNNWTGGSGGIVNCTVTNGTVTAIAISTAGSGYLAGGNGVWAPEFGFGFKGTITVSGGICTASSVTNGGIGFTSNPTLAIGNLTLPSGIGAGSGTLALTGTATAATGYAIRLLDVQSAKISGNWLESINSNVRLETGTGALSCKNVQITDNTLVSSAEHITLEDSGNEYTALHNTRIGPTAADSTTTIASGVIRAVGNLIKLAPEGGVADSLDTINGALGFGHMLTLVGSATAAITVTAAGNIRPLAGGTRSLANQYASMDLRWNGSLWCESGFTDVVPPDAGLLTATWAGLSGYAAATYSGRCILITDVGVDGGSIWVSNGSIWAPTGPIILARSAVQSAGHTGTVTETTVQSVTIPAGLMGTNRSIRVRHTWSMTANVNAKTFRARLSTAASPPNGTAFNSTASGATTVTTVLTGMISNRNSASAQVVDPGALTGNGGNSTAAVATGTLNSANASYIVFSAELGNTGDTVYLERYQVELVP